MYKFGTVAELEALNLKGKLPDVLYQKAMEIVAGLDEYFGEGRDIDEDEGGYVYIAENKDDLAYFEQNCIEIEAPSLEYADVVHTEEEDYLNAFWLINEYAYGITLLVPVSIAPAILMEETAAAVHR